jgi:hypothetical protein
MISLIILVIGVILSFTLFGCDKDDPNEPDIHGTGGGSTSVPSELRGTWYELSRFDEEEDQLTIADISFTENRLYVGDPDYDFGMELLVRVTGKKIEYASLLDTGFLLPVTLCESYNISNGVLTFTGGLADGESYKQKGS